MSYAKFREAFAEVLDQRYWPIDWLDKRVEEGRAVCIWTPKAAVVVELRLYPGGAMDVHGLLAAGDRGDIVEILIPQAEEWGRKQGCIAGVVESRPAWAKLLKQSGYEVSQVTVRKEL